MIQTTETRDTVQVDSPLAAIAEAVSEALGDDVVSFGPTRLDIAIGETDLTFKADDDPEQMAGKLANTALAIEEAHGQAPGVLFHEVDPGIRQIRVSDFEGVSFTMDDSDNEADAIAQVREFLAGLQVAGVAG